LDFGSKAYDTQTFINGEHNILSTGGEFKPMRKQGSEPTKSRFVPTKTSLPSTTIPKSKTETIKRAINNWIATVVLKSGFCSLDAKFKADLNNSINIADNLKEILKAQGLSLTEHATVKNVPEGEWVITSGEEIYRVYKEDERLVIYKHHNKDRLDVLSTVVRSVVERSTGDGIILFPAGMFYTEDKAASTFYFKVSLGFFLMNNHLYKNIFSSYCLYIPFC